MPEIPPPQPEDDLPEFEDRAKPFLIRTALLLGVIVIVVIGIKPAIGRFKKQRSLTAAESAEALMLQQRSDEAEARLKEALALNPNQPRVLRLAAQFFSRQGRVEALELWHRLLGSPEATREDRFQYVDLALSLNRLDLASDQLEAMVRLDPKDNKTQRLLLRLHTQKDDLASAIAVANSLLDEKPTDEEAQFTLGKLLLRHTQPDARANGRHMLSKLALGIGPFQRSSLELLLGDRELDSKEATLLLKTLQARTGAKITDRLKVASLHLRVEPSRRAEIVSGVASSVGPSASSLDLLAIVEWLESLGEHEAIIELLTLDRLNREGGLLNSRLQALAWLNRPTEVQTALSDPQAPLNRSQRDRLRATLAARGGRSDEAKSELLKSIAATGSDATNLLAIASLAERLNQPEAAVTAHEKLLNDPAFGVAAAREIVRLLESFDDLKSLQETVHRLATSVPGFKNLAVEDAYLSLLIGERIEDARSTLVGLVAQNPKDIRVRAALALAELLNKDPAAALALLEAEPIDWTKAPARVQAVYVAVLAGNGQVDAARSWAKRVDLSRLKSAEQEFVRRWL